MNFAICQNMHTTAAMPANGAAVFGMMAQMPPMQPAMPAMQPQMRPQPPGAGGSS